MWLTLGIALASGLGSVTRYTLDLAVARRAGRNFPYGMLLINVTGSFLLGLVIGLSMHHGWTNGTTLLLGTGFAGGYTTLSTWAWETLLLLRDRRYRRAALNAFLSVTTGLLAVSAGLGLAAQS